MYLGCFGNNHLRISVYCSFSILCVHVCFVLQSLTRVNNEREEGSGEEKLTSEQIKEAEDFYNRLHKFQEERGKTHST